ncbi:hypothetical protein KIN20_003412 [Parelaphostrongylus tenuis]|uniref:Uncharacterized protein n=1 Tax=Parelaphostrongylus tenuis TaxID=148309 RepID=A0AAD5M1E5_PARTN|nr:hypothetical protein KIN20_003412 [Parelaphostrongylus tenuis]
MTRRADFRRLVIYFTTIRYKNYEISLQRALGPSLPAGPSNLPIIAVYTENSVVSALVPGIATSKGAVQALAQRFAMQTVVDVLEIEGRRALLPDFVISNILGQLQVNTTYEPLECQLLMGPGEQQAPMESCIYVGSTVTGICPMNGGGNNMCHKVAKAIDEQTLVPLRNSHGLDGFIICTTSFYEEKIPCRLRTSSWLIGRGRCGKMLWTERFDC